MSDLKKFNSVFFGDMQSESKPISYKRTNGKSQLSLVSSLMHLRAIFRQQEMFRHVTLNEVFFNPVEFKQNLLKYVNAVKRERASSKSLKQLFLPIRAVDAKSHMCIMRKFIDHFVRFAT